MREARIRTFKDLIVWQKAFELGLQLYRVTRSFPMEERFGLTAELRKTARSVACNIAEGHRRRSTTEYVRFLDIASGSAAELATQLLLAGELRYFDKNQAHALRALHGEVERMLAALMRSLQERASR
ncbi:MAG: four helix bundle protein [Deltaproteobacteria bacterium]|nr:four helix bundle protein [Deltaproteobacteria bacterium]